MPARAARVVKSFEKIFANCSIRVTVADCANNFDNECHVAHLFPVRVTESNSCTNHLLQQLQ